MRPPILLIHGERSRDVVYRKCLSSAGLTLEICVAETPADVRSHPLPEVVLLDLDHTHPSSFEILQWLRSEPPYARIPVIALTSSQEPDRINRAYELGANSCVLKNRDGFTAETARGIAAFANVLSGG